LRILLEQPGAEESAAQQHPVAGLRLGRQLQQHVVEIQPDNVPLIAEKGAFVVGVSHAKSQRGFTLHGRPVRRALREQARQPVGKLVIALIGNQTVRCTQRGQG